MPSKLRSKTPPLPETSGPDQVRRLAEIVRRQLDEVEATPDIDPLKKARIFSSAATSLTLLGRMTGATRDVSEARILKSPAWQRVGAAIAAALAPYPKAALAVADVLERLGRDGQ